MIQAAELRIQRKCPSCGGPIRHTDADRVVACDFCGIRLAVTHGGTARYALPARGSESEWILDGKRALRERSRHLRELQAPSLIYAPFYRLRAMTWQCWRESDHADHSRAPKEPEEAPFQDPNPFRYRVGVWDQTFDAVPSLDLGDRHLGFRPQVFEVVPLGDLVGSGRIAVEVSPEVALRELLKRLVAALGMPPADVLGQALYAPFPQLQLLYYPYIILPFRSSDTVDGQESVVLDGLTGHFRAFLSAEDGLRLTAALEIRPGDSEAWSTPASEAQIHALICPSCSSPLPWAPRAHVHQCSVCQQCWRMRDGDLVSVPSTMLVPIPSVAHAVRRERENRAGGRRVDLPFYRVPITAPEQPGASRFAYLPAFQGKHARPVWNFAFAANRLQPEYEQNAETPARPGAAIELDPEEARALLPFLDLCLRAPTMLTWPLGRSEFASESAPVPMSKPTTPSTPATQQSALPQLVWIPFYNRTGDLTEASTGLGISASAIPDWTMAEVSGCRSGGR